MKTIKKWSAALWMSVLLMFAAAIPAAAEELGGFGLLIGYGGDGEVAVAQTAYVIKLGGYLRVYTAIADPVDDSVDFYFEPVGTENKYPVKLSRNQDGMCMLWELGEEYVSETAFPCIAYPQKGMQVNVLYFSDSGWVVDQEATITELAKAEGSELLYQEKVEGFDGAGSYYFPAILLNEGNCFGFLYSETEALTLFGDVDIFYNAPVNETETAAPESQETSLETEEGTALGKEPETKRETEPETKTVSETASEQETSPAGEQEEDDSSKKNLLGAAVIVVLAAIAGAAVYMTRKKNHTVPGSAPSADKTPEPDKSLTVKIEGSQAEETSQQKASFYVKAVGGSLDGNAYPITGAEITFGWENGNTVQFPGETKNINLRHCKLFWHHGNLALMDVGSSYGTYLEGYGKLQKGQAVPVKCGDIFYLAEKENSFTIQ